MKVQNINNSQYTNFKSIKSIKRQGLYKKFPGMCQNLVEALNNNPNAMNFFKENDVNIVLHAKESGYNDVVESTLCIFYKNPAFGKIKSIIKSILGNKDKVVIRGWGQGLDNSTKDLTECIIPYEKGKKNEGHFGILDSHIDSAKQAIKEAFDKKRAKKESEDFAAKTRNELENKKRQDEKSLEDSLKDFIDKTK